MNFCHNCGVHIEANTKFCPNCGTSLNIIVQDKNTDTSLKVNNINKVVKTMNLASVCLLLPYVILAFVISFFADFYSVDDRIGYMLGLAWPVVFLLVLFFLVRYIDKRDYTNKSVINIHLVLSIILIGSLVLGGIIMLLLSYGLIVFPFISSILHVIIAFKIKKNLLAP